MITKAYIIKITEVINFNEHGWVKFDIQIYSVVAIGISTDLAATSANAAKLFDVLS